MGLFVVVVILVVVFMFLFSSVVVMCWCDDLVVRCFISVVCLVL